MAGVYIWQDVLSQHHIDPGIIVEGPLSEPNKMGYRELLSVGSIIA